MLSLTRPTTRLKSLRCMSLRVAAHGEPRRPDVSVAESR